MKTLSWLATGIIFSASRNIAHAAPAVRRWTIMVYMSGDNNLEDYIVKDIEEELGLAGSNADMKIVALADRGPATTRAAATGRRPSASRTQGIVAMRKRGSRLGRRNFGDARR